MQTAATFKICCNCGAKAPLAKRFCNSPTGCGPVDRQTRRMSKGSVWRKPTAEEAAQDQADRDRRNAFLEKLLSEIEDEPLVMAEAA